MRVAALIPARNEADRIAATVLAVSCLESVVGCIVIDDASRDETERCAREAGAVVGRLPFNQGKGAALNHGCKMLETLAPFGPLESLDAVLLIDADLASSAEQAVVLVSALGEGVDMAIAGFPPAAGKAGFGMVKSLAHQAILELGGFDAQSPLSGQRALTIPCLKAVRPFADGFGVEVDMSIRALWAGMYLVEVPTTMTHRASGSNLRGFMHRGRQFFDVDRTVRKLVKEQKRLSQRR